MFLLFCFFPATLGPNAAWDAERNRLGGYDVATVRRLPQPARLCRYSDQPPAHHTWSPTTSPNDKKDRSMSGEGTSRGINILCIDGGGVGDLSSLVLLGEIMGRLGGLEGRNERPDPAEYFDVIAGSGTGGLIACMLGRLGISLSETTDAYVEPLSKVFSNKKALGTSGRSVYKGTQLRETLRSLVQKATGNGEERMRHQIPNNLPKTIVFAMARQNLNANIPVLFRSYDSARNPAPDCVIWEALYATMADPELFKSIDISDGAIRLSFVGGGVGCSNPIAHVLSEVGILYQDQYVSCVLSIGAGYARTISLPDPSLSRQLINIHETMAMKCMAADSEREAEVVAARFRNTSDLYYRFNVDQGMQDVDVDDWEKLGEVVAHTRVSIGKVESGQGIDRAARSIMERKAAVSVKQLDGSVQVPSNEPIVHLKHFPAPSSMFTGREDQIQQVSTCTAHGNNERRVCVIYGLGGAGKTQLALKTIERYHDNWTHTLFVDASSQGTIESTLQDIAQAKDIGKTYEDTLRWLATCHEPWLLVYDNADNPSLGIHKYFPGGNRGTILITTRLADMKLHARGPSSECRVFDMSQEDSLVLLLRLACMQGQIVTESEINAATALLKDFGHFALAIVHAGAYIGHSHMSILDYRNLFLAHRRSMLERYGKLKVKVDDYQWSVFTTWALCYDMLEENGSSQMLLWLIAFLHHGRITPNMFECAAINIKNYMPLFPPNELESAAHKHVQGFLSRFMNENEEWDATLFSDTINELAAYSLVDYNPLNGAYKIHVLVQEWAKTVIPQPVLLALESHAVDWRNTALAYKSRFHLGLHVVKVLSEQHDTFGANHAPNFARVYKTKGQWDRKEALELRMREERERALGTEHPETLMCLNSLASTYRRQGRWDEAGQLHAQVLNASRRILGEEHPCTLTSRGNLASTYSRQGRWSEAEQLQVEVLEAHRRTIGDKHPDTLASMGNLASTYWRQSRWNEAEHLQLQALGASVQALGGEHPMTLVLQHNLAATYVEQGRWDETEQLLAQAVDARTRIVGDQHPRTMSPRRKVESIRMRRLKSN